MDVVCQAKSGMGKTAVFVLATLQQLDKEKADNSGGPQVLVMCHTRELAFQISKEYQRFSKYMENLKVCARPYQGSTHRCLTVIHFLGCCIFRWYANRQGQENIEGESTSYCRRNSRSPQGFDPRPIIELEKYQTLCS